MKKLIAVLMLSAFLPASRAFADRAAHNEHDIKLLNDSSAALTGIDSGLARKVQRYASKESGETEAKAGKKAKTREKAKTDKDDIEMLREASRKLKPTRPDLSKGLDRYAEMESREVKP